MIQDEHAAAGVLLHDLAGGAATMALFHFLVVENVFAQLFEEVSEPPWFSRETPRIVESRRNEHGPLDILRFEDR